MDTSAVTGQFEVWVEGFFNTTHHIDSPLGNWGDLTLPGFANQATFETQDGRTLNLVQTRWWASTYELREGHMVVGTASPRGFLKNEMDVGFRGLMYRLVPEGIFSTAWRLLDAEGNTVILVDRRGIFKAGAYVTAQVPVPLDLVVFTYYLVNRRWQQQSAAAASTAAAAGS